MVDVMVRALDRVHGGRILARIEVAVNWIGSMSSMRTAPFASAVPARENSAHDRDPAGGGPVVRAGDPKCRAPTAGFRK